MYRLTLAFALSCLTAAGAAAEKDKFPGIKNIMSETEFQQSGLGKLSASELQALNRWLLRYTANDAQIMRQQVQEVRAESQKGFRTQIDGEFNGWRGETVFRLKNGQVWKQRLRGRWKTKLTDPEVVISRNLLGFYEMTVVEGDKKIGVKRVR